MKPLTFMTMLLATLLVPLTTRAAEAPHSGGTHWMIKADQLEWRDAEDSGASAWDVSAWIGGDLNKLSLASEGEREADRTHSAETRLAWQRAVAPFWDLQLGWLRDWQPDDPNRDWAMIAFQGTAPWFVETRAQFFLGGEGRTRLRLDVEKELLITQRLHLVPEIEADFYGRRDVHQQVDHGLASVEAGLRLRYEIRRQIAPYIGVHHERLHGGTADMALAGGEDRAETRFVAGLRLWY